MKNYLLLLALAASFSISSCSKDDDDKDEPAPIATPPTTTPTPVTIQNPLTGLTQGSTDPAVIQFTKEMLTGSEWELTALVKGVENSLNFRDIYKDIADCERDDVYSFGNAGNTFTVTDNFYWCGTGTTSQPRTGTYTMANSVSLTITAPGVTQPGLTGNFSIMQVSETSLVLQQKAGGFIFVATFEKHVPETGNHVMLVNKNWKVTSDVTYDYYTGNTSSATACKLDNIVFFGGNGKVTKNEGALACPNTMPIEVTDYYFYGYGLNYSNQQYNIQELTATKLVLTHYEYSQGYGLRTITYIKQ